MDPACAADCMADWIALRREIIAREKCSVRGGGGNTIEIARGDGVWARLALPNSTWNFASPQERDLVLAQLSLPHRYEEKKNQDPAG